MKACAFQRRADVVALADAAEIPGLCFLRMRTFWRPSSHCWWIPECPHPEGTSCKTLGTDVHPADLRWIYLTHPDRDHTGSLMEVLEAAPAACLVTTFLGLGILSLEYVIPPSASSCLTRVSHLILVTGALPPSGRRSTTARRPPASMTN